MTNHEQNFIDENEQVTQQDDNKLKQVTNGKLDMPLYHVNKILFVLYEENQALHLVRQYCFMTTCDENKRMGLEFLYWNGFFEALPILIEKNYQSENPINQQWAWIYGVMLDRLKNRPDPYEYMEKVKKKGFIDADLQCLSTFLMVYAYFELHQFGKLGTYLEQIQSHLERMEQNFLQDMFTDRYYELVFQYHWRRNELLIGRKFAYHFMNRSNNLFKKTQMHIQLAETYVFESYEQAMFHIQEARSIAKRRNDSFSIKLIESRTIPFIAAVNEKAEGIVTTYLPEKAHVAIVNGDVETGIAILESFEELTPFQQYYLGKATQNKLYLQKAHDRLLNEQSDYFFARLPLRELQKLQQHTYYQNG
ncbi:hypothetical protein GLW08_14660 [Pontibacillus yanchengensis]|uniref:Uncharacterized protein n=1 Tax=Pontibacillus yanchengensis TaxID=462910 RepID=A0ACC7VK96_9BACI|nr:AimR family lysis-lysogeny pheromone receptor [Pontibacillus yanchengensis]MYL54574.1 hypothetical protein [Pontibacillus yanchengensis]